jgi:hypothetical protein
LSVPAITISAFRGDVPVTLEDILKVLGTRARSARWRISALEVAPALSADRLHAASDQGTLLAGEELFGLASGIQVIDGEFAASGGDAGEPWVLLRAVDGASWDVITDDVEVIRDFARSFPDATPLP